MKTWIEKTWRFLVSEDGPTAVEYAVMLAMILMVCLVAVTLFGTRTSALFRGAAQSLGAS